jgi:hypothetical protein
MPACWYPNIFPGPPETALHFVGDEHDAVPFGHRAQTLHERDRRGDEAAFAQFGFDDDRGHVFGHDLGPEQLLQRVDGPFRRPAAVLVRKRRVVDVGRERAEVLPVRRARRGHRQRKQRPPVEAAAERDDCRSPGVRARDLDGVLDRFRACREQHTLVRVHPTDQRA